MIGPSWAAREVAVVPLGHAGDDTRPLRYYNVISSTIVTRSELDHITPTKKQPKSKNSIGFT